MSDTSGTGRTTAERVAYFVVRVRLDLTDPAAALTGTLERLGSGRAMHFGGTEELLYLLTNGAHEAPAVGRTGIE
jgi:hypothetical protein